MNIDVLAVLFATAWYNLIKILVQVSISLKLTVSFKFKLLKPSVFANIKLQLEGSVKLPRDRSLHGQLETNVRKLLSSEKDRDVSCAIRQAILELDRTEVAMESVCSSTVNNFFRILIKKKVL